jgi:hypothetical protein
MFNDMWYGKEIAKCNGKIQDFSVLYSRLTDDFTDKVVVRYDQMGRKTISLESDFWSIVFGSFTKPKIEEEMYRL